MTASARSRSITLVGPPFLFGSELKALRKHPEWRGEIDRGAVAVYLRHNYIPAPHSIYVGVRKVLPGTVVTVGPDRQVREQRYWSMAEAAERGAANPLVMSEAEAANEMEQITVHRRCKSVPRRVPLRWRTRRSSSR